MYRQAHNNDVHYFIGFANDHHNRHYFWKICFHDTWAAKLLAYLHCFSLTWQLDHLIIHKFFTSILFIKKNRGYRFGRWPCASALTFYNSVTALFEGVRKIVLVWNFVRMYIPKLGFKKKNFGVGRHLLCYLYDPFSTFLCMCALFSVATSVKMNGFTGSFDK